jgi:sugar-specific transcriptional regulator TrmB
MSSESHASRQIQVLRDLGLSRAESEVYLACLQLGAGGAGTLSSYRVAQEMGRDPANVGKIVNALAHLQAIRVVQEKPRLFVAVPPEEFTDHLLGRMRRRGAEAVSLLEDFGGQSADGVAQALTSRDQTAARARALFAACRRDLLVAGSPEMVRELGLDLERVAETPGCRVRVVSPQAFSSSVVEISALPTAGRLGQDQNEDWLLVACDDQSWLVALLPQAGTASEGPCGWWSSGSVLARVWADYLEQCWRTGVRAGSGREVPVVEAPAVEVPAVEDAPVPASFPSFAAEMPAATVDHGVAARADEPPAAAATPSAQTTQATDTPPTTPKPAAEPAAAPAPWTRSLSADEADQAGFSFLFKHERKPGRDGR